MQLRGGFQNKSNYRGTQSKLRCLLKVQILQFLKIFSKKLSSLFGPDARVSMTFQLQIKIKIQLLWGMHTKRGRGEYQFLQS